MARRPRVLVTRPEPGATRTAHALEAAGYEPVLLPLTEIVGLPVEAPLMDAAGSADLVTATSINAVTHAPEPLIAALRHRPFIAVGDATAEAASECGFADVRSVDGDAEALAAALLAAHDRAGNIAYLCGRVRTSTLEDALSNGGVDCVLIETYDTQKVSHMTEYGLPERIGGLVDAVMLHSAVTAAHYANLDASQASDNIAIIAMSDRIASALPASLAARTLVAERPREDAMLAALRQAVPPR